MGRPIKKIFIGERTGFGAGGEGLADITFGGTNDSDGYTVADVLTIDAPDLEGGVQATGEVLTTFADGALIEGITDEDSFSGLGVNGTSGTFTDLTQKSGSGTGATWTIIKGGGQTDYSDISSIVITALGSGYSLGDVIVISGADFGDVDATNDFSFDIAAGSFVTAGTIETLDITEAGSGYTSVPAITAATDNQNNLTLTGVLTSGSIPVITATAYVTANNLNADITAQKGNTTYKVTTSEGTLDCTLVIATPAAVGEMAIIAEDSGDGVYFVTKLYNGHVRLFRTGGTAQFADGVKVKWAEDGIAVEDVSVTISA